MTSGVLIRRTVVGCAILAVAAASALSVTGHVGEGLSLGVGLILGSANGYLLQGLLDRRAPFVAASLLRIVALSSLVLVAALAVRETAWAVALGIGLAQLVMVGVGVGAGLRR